MPLAEMTYRFSSEHSPRMLPADPHAACARLEAGNRAFSDLLRNCSQAAPARLRINVDIRNVGLGPGGESALRQAPFAAIIGCSDARVPVELVFSEGPNDLFVVRIVGNGLGDDVLGSLNYATEHLKESLRTIVVLGHSECGAVSAAVDVYLTPARYVDLMTQTDLRHVLDRLLVIVQSSAKWLERVYGENVVRSQGYRSALVEISIALNAALTANGILISLNAECRSRLSVVYGVYVINEHLVWCPRPDAEWHGLCPAPQSAGDLVKLYDTVAASPRIRDILHTTGTAKEFTP